MAASAYRLFLFIPKLGLSPARLPLGTDMTQEPTT